MTGCMPKAWFELAKTIRFTPWRRAPFVDLVQSPKIVLDDLREWTLHAGPGQVDQDIDSPKQPIDHLRIAKVSVHHLLGIGDRRERALSAARSQLDAPFVPTDTLAERRYQNGTGRR